jgi:sialate O-acetylesterase
MFHVGCRARSTVAIFCLAFIAVARGVREEVKLPSLLSDSMVLQQGMKVNIWGTANPGERVTVTLKDEEVNGVADARASGR